VAAQKRTIQKKVGVRREFIIRHLFIPSEFTERRVTL